jgi:DNA-binding NtrC family response regulator
MSKTLKSQLDEPKYDSDTIIAKPINLETTQKSPITLSAIDTSTEHKNSTTELFGFKQSKVIIIDVTGGKSSELDTLLQGWQCDTQVFSSVEEAVRILAQQTWKPRLIISDACLAVNTLDIEAIKLIQDFYVFDVEAIILMADTNPIIIQLAKDSGFTILHKPINPAQLRFTMKKKLSSRSY